MSAVVQRKLVISDEAGDELVIESTSGGAHVATAITTDGSLVCLTAQDVDALYLFLQDEVKA